MPRLTKAQKDAKEAEKTALSAQLAAEAQASSRDNAPPPPSASALSTNQPVGRTSMEAASLEGRRSTSIVSDQYQNDRAHVAKETSGSAVYAHESNSELSTSEGEGSSDEEGKADRSNLSLADELDEDEDAEPTESPEVKCMWEDCGQVFTTLAPFIHHLHEDHVGIHKARYSCEWTGCPRKGKGQTSRFALLSHLRSHTGEKPFTCPRPECDKSFTRSDALAKHMRVQHNVNPVSSRGRASQHGPSNRSQRAKNDGGEEEDSSVVGDDTLGSTDLANEELLDLAEGEINGYQPRTYSEVEESIMAYGAKSPSFTYSNLFGNGASLIAQANGSDLRNEIIPDEELGILRDTKPSRSILVDENIRDEEVCEQEEKEMTKVLENGRKEWIQREKEKASHRPAPDFAPLDRRSTGDEKDIFSDDEQDAGAFHVSKRPRRSSTRNSRGTQYLLDGAALKKLYLIEKAKLQVIRKENERMRRQLTLLRDTERTEMLEKRITLEKALEAELGRDVGAIFSPPPSPRIDSHS